MWRSDEDDSISGTFEFFDLQNAALDPVGLQSLQTGPYMPGATPSVTLYSPITQGATLGDQGSPSLQYPVPVEPLALQDSANDGLVSRIYTVTLYSN
jgi:hypothetical protein